MKRKLICILFAFTILFTASSPALAVGIEAQTDRIIEKQEPLIEMYNQILNAPSVLSNETASFEYGGAWIDEQYLHINVFGDLVSASVYYSSLCNDPDSLQFHSVNYSYADLCELAYEITLVAPEEVVNVGIDDVSNCIIIGVDKALISERNLSTDGAENDFLLSLKTNICDAVQESSAEKFSSNFPNAEFPVELIFENPTTVSATPLTGGMGLSNDIFDFSLGLCGTYWNSSGEQVDVIVMCGHGLTSGQTIYVNGVGVGTVIKKQFLGGYYYDYGVVQITNGNFTPTSEVRGFTLTSEASSHPVGTTVKKYGRNGFSVGTITQSSFSSYRSDAGGYVYGLVRVDISEGYIGYNGGGDSGGTIYAGNTFYGIYSADDKSSSSSTDATYYVYSPSNGITGFDVY